eukprot:12074498-Alexandrium_andersonii.AAC.1
MRRRDDPLHWARVARPCARKARKRAAAERPREATAPAQGYAAPQAEAAASARVPTGRPAAG